MSTLIGPEGRIYAFEPEENNLSYLRRSIEFNRITNVEVMACAVSDTDGVQAFDRRGGAFSGRLVAAGHKGRIRDVPVRSLDSLTARSCLRAPSLCKIDVEGAEADVLMGASGVLARDRPTILVEMHPDNPDGMRRAASTLWSAHYDLFELRTFLREPAPVRLEAGRFGHLVAIPRETPDDLKRPQPARP